MQEVLLLHVERTGFDFEFQTAGDLLFETDYNELYQHCNKAVVISLDVAVT
jgi:hypothetical protein